MSKFIIAHDFNGVLDVKNSETIKENGLSFRIRKQANIDNVRALLTLALKTNTPLVSISSLEQYQSINQCILAAMIHRGTEEDKTFFTENKRAFRKLFTRSPTPGQKQATVDHFEKEGYTVIALEDEVILKNCEMCMINGRNINKALAKIEELTA